MSIFPPKEDNSFGLRKFTKVKHCTNFKVDEKVIKENISRWPKFLNMFLGYKAAKYIHSINEIFSQNELPSKAFTTFDLLSQLPDLPRNNVVELKEMLGMNENE